MGRRARVSRYYGSMWLSALSGPVVYTCKRLCTYQALRVQLEVHSREAHLRLRPSPAPARGRRVLAALGWAGQGGAIGQASQPVTVQIHQAMVTGLDKMPRCQAVSSMMPARRYHR